MLWKDSFYPHWSEKELWLSQKKREFFQHEKSMKWSLQVWTVLRQSRGTLPWLFLFFLLIQLKSHQNPCVFQENTLTLHHRIIKALENAVTSNWFNVYITLIPNTLEGIWKTKSLATSLSAKSDVTSWHQRVTSLFYFTLINICATLELDIEQTSFTRWNDELKDVNYAELHENSKW